LASLLRHGTPIPIHGGQGNLLTVNLAEKSQLANRSIAEVFERFPELLAVVIIRDQQIQLPRGSTQFKAEINCWLSQVKRPASKASNSSREAYSVNLHRRKCQCIFRSNNHGHSLLSEL
jgi:hypothetical protein